MPTDGPALDEAFDERLLLRNAGVGLHAGAGPSCATTDPADEAAEAQGPTTGASARGEVDAEQFARKQREFRERDQSELAEITSKTFELSQNLKDKRLVSDYPEKRAILEIVASNFALDDVTLVPQIRKPFGKRAEGLHLVQSVP